MNNNKQKKLVNLLLIFGIGSLLSACITRGANPEDPYESYNRKIFKINQNLDNAVLKPVAKFYQAVLPWPVRKGVHNVIGNLDDVKTVVNDVLQVNFKYALKDTTRLFVNTTIGIGGVFDFASEMNLPKHYNDFGLTFAKWGDPNSPYFILPLLGPSTVRDSFGMIYDYAASPYPYLFKHDYAETALLSLRAIDIRAKYLEADRLMNEAALDPYTFQRDAYLQNRKYLMNINSGAATDPYVESDDAKLHHTAATDKSAKTSDNKKNSTAKTKQQLREKKTETPKQTSLKPAHQSYIDSVPDKKKS